MPNWLASVERQDLIIVTGLLMLAGGLLTVSITAALAVPGALLFLLGVGWFLPKGR